MVIVDISKLDLNLLRTLCILLEEGSVAATASRLNLTASAVSHTLRRLRETFGDPLFVRVGQGLRPTAKAVQIGGIAAPAIERLTEALGAMQARQADDPRLRARTLRLVAPGALELTLVPLLAGLLRREAPDWRLRVTGFERRGYEADLMSDAVDLVLSVGGQTPASESVEVSEVWQDQMVCLVGPSHRFAKQPGMTLAEYLDCDFVYPLPWPRTQQYLDVWLARDGRRRRLPVAVPGYAAVAPLLLATDLAATMPDRTALALKAMHPALSICRVEPVLRSPLRLEHRRRTLDDPQLGWIIARLMDAAASVAGLG